MRVELGICYSESFADSRRLDLFVPQQPNGRGILLIHGGGWRSGSPAMWHYTAEHLGGQGYVCASCGYRLAPQHRFPAQVEDVRLAMAWMRGRAKDLGFGADRVAVLGSSAGGHLAAMLATVGPDDALGRTEELSCLDTRPNAVVCDCPVTFFEDAGEAISEARRGFLGGTTEEISEVGAVASPLHRVTGDEPPFLLVHGELDTVVPPVHSVRLAERLEAAGVPVELVIVPKLAHGFAFHRDCPLHPEIHRRMEAFLDRHLAG